MSVDFSGNISSVVINNKKVKTIVRARDDVVIYDRTVHYDYIVTNQTEFANYPIKSIKLLNID